MLETEDSQDHMELGDAKEVEVEVEEAEVEEVEVVEEEEEAIKYLQELNVPW